MQPAGWTMNTAKIPLDHKCHKANWNSNWVSYHKFGWPGLMGSVRSWGGTLNSCTSSNVQCSLTESVQVTGHPVMTPVFFSRCTGTIIFFGAFLWWQVHTRYERILEKGSQRHWLEPINHGLVHQGCRPPFVRTWIMEGASLSLIRFTVDDCS